MLYHLYLLFQLLKMMILHWYLSVPALLLLAILFVVLANRSRHKLGFDKTDDGY